MTSHPLDAIPLKLLPAIVRKLQLRGAHLDRCEVVTVARWGGIVNGDACPARRSGGILHLDPVSVAAGREELMHERLTGAGSPSNRIVKVIADSKNP